MQAISQDWCAGQQQTSTSRLKKLRLFYLKFSVKFNELSPNFQKQEEIAKKKKAKTKKI